MKEVLELGRMLLGIIKFRLAGIMKPLMPIALAAVLIAPAVSQGRETTSASAQMEQATKKVEPWATSSKETPSRQSQVQKDKAAMEWVQAFCEDRQTPGTFSDEFKGVLLPSASPQVQEVAKAMVEDHVKTASPEGTSYASFLKRNNWEETAPTAKSRRDGRRSKRSSTASRCPEEPEKRMPSARG